ncbi:MAG: glycosyltransferase [Gammaproteobacteria bacterium]
MKQAVFHGPANIGGIGRYTADWQRKHGFISDFITYQENPLIPNSHVCLHLDNYNRISRQIIRLLFFILCLHKYKIFNFYFGITFYKTNIDLPILKLFRKKVIMTYCGSDIRLIEVEHTRNPYSHLLKIGIDDPKYDFIKKLRMRWQCIWINKVLAPRNLYAYAREVFPEKKIIKDIWIHNSLELSKDQSNKYKLKSPPVIVHAPSAKLIKGTKYVERAIDVLKSKGYKFEYKCLNNIGNDQVKKILKEEADIILDQFLLGGFGTFAIEAMSYGKPVVGYLLESVKEQHYPDCPIVNATIDNLPQVLESLLKNPVRMAQLGSEGRIFAKKNVDRDILNKKLLDIYNDL